MIIKICPICKIEFETYPSLENYRKFCSRKCKAEKERINFENNNPMYNSKSIEKLKKNHWAYNLNKRKKVLLKKSESIKKIYKNGKQGNMGFKKGKDNVSKRPEVREIHRETALKLYKEGKLGKTGNQHPNWKGGVSKEPYSFEFNKELKNKIRKRDSFTCQECGYSEKQLKYKLSIHHINYNKKDCSENNLISLCKMCHSQTNFNRSNWENYFKNKITNKF